MAFNFATTPTTVPSTNIQWNAIQNGANNNSLVSQLLAGKPATQSPSVVAASTAVKNTNAPLTSPNPTPNPLSAGTLSLTNPNAGFNSSVGTTLPQPQVNNSLSTQYPSLVGATAPKTTTPVAQNNTQPQQQYPAASTAPIQPISGPTQDTSSPQQQDTSAQQQQYQQQQATLQNTIQQLIQQGMQGSPQMAQAQAAYEKSVQALSDFNQNLAKANAGIEQQAIPLEFQQGQEQVLARQAASQQAALQGAVNQNQTAIGQAQTAQGQQLSALESAAGLLTPASQFAQVPYSNQIINSQGQNIQNGSGGSSLPQTAQDFISSLATQVRNNQMSRADAESKVSAYSQPGLQLLNQLLGTGFNTAANAGATSATQANTQAVGVAPVNAQLGVYNTQLGNLGTSQVAASQIAAFGNQLLTTMSQPPSQGGLGINPYSSQYANLKLNQLKTQFNDPQYATFNTNIAGLQARVSSLLQTGEIPTAATQGAQDIVNGNATLAAMQATLQQIGAEAGAITGSQAQVASTAYQQALKAAGGNTTANTSIGSFKLDPTGKWVPA